MNYINQNSQSNKAITSSIRLHKKNSTTQWLQTDLAQLVGVSTITQLVWFTGLPSQHSHFWPCNLKVTHLTREYLLNICPQWGFFHRSNKGIRQTFAKGHNNCKICQTWIISPHAHPDLCCNTSAEFHSNLCYNAGIKTLSWNCVKSLTSKQNLLHINYLPTWIFKLLVQHSCQFLFKSMQECRSNWEDKFKYLRIVSVSIAITQTKVEHELSSLLHIYTCGATILPSFIQIHATM